MLNGDRGLVIPEGLQGLSDLPGRLAFKTLQPQPVHFTVLDEGGRNGQGSLDIGQLFSRESLNDDPYGFGCRNSRRGQDEEEDRKK